MKLLIMMNLQLKAVSILLKHQKKEAIRRSLLQFSPITFKQKMILIARKLIKIQKISRSFNLKDELCIQINKIL